MATVGEFLKFLSSPQNQLSPVALTYKNYFQYLFDPQEELEADALQSFFDSALTYPHWQQNRKDLTSEGRTLLESFFGTGGASLIAAEGASMLDALDWPADQQVIEIENNQTALEILSNYWTFRLKREGAQFRLIEAKDRMFLTLILGTDGRLTIRQYDHRFVVRNGHLEPLRRDLMLVYNSELELDPTVMHKFEVSPFTVARFYRDGTSAGPYGIHGNTTRGYIFQHLQNFHGQPLEQFPRLFFALKRIEQHFIRRDTDPYYISLVEGLERILHWMRLGEPVSPQLLHENFLRAQTAIEEVFTGDKMLTLLLRDLEHLNARDQLRHPDRPKAFTPSRGVGQLPANLDFVDETPAPSDAVKTAFPSRQQEPAWNRKTEFASTKPSPTPALRPAAKPTASSPRGASPSTGSASMNSESKWIPGRTRSLFRENP